MSTQRRKFFIATTIVLINFDTTIGSSIPSGASDSLNKAFEVTSQLQTPLPVAVFLIGYVLGPIVFAPLSEWKGRRPVFLASFALFTAFSLGCALAPNWVSLLFFRFMMGCGAAVPQTVSSGLFSDIYSDLGPRGIAVTALGLTSNVGALVGPMISGFTSTEVWQWQFWFLLIFSALLWPPLLMIPGWFLSLSLSPLQRFFQPLKRSLVR
jgi:MFS family permease